MNNLIIKKQPFIGYIPKNKKEYRKFIRLILKYTDFVYFKITPYLDDIDEFNNSIWSAMKYSVLDYGFAQAASDFPGDKSHLILLKKDHCLYDFLMNKNGIFDFEEEDSNLGITLEDPAFIKDDEVFCYTVTHEKICILTNDIYKLLCDK